MLSKASDARRRVLGASWDVIAETLLVAVVRVPSNPAF